MCYIDGSIDQATSTCPMCKIFRPAARCPHKTDVCRNKALHPRHDVVHFKNAEVQSFNGCGYCKWARTIPPPNKSGYHNPGWPGCCRPPSPQDYVYISPADWPAISSLHRIPIPAEVKAFLDALPPAKVSIIGRGNQTQSPKDKGIHSSTKAIAVTSSRALSDAGPSKSRAGGSPQSSVSSSPPWVSPLRSDLIDSPEQRVENIRTTPPVTARKLAEPENYDSVRVRPSSSSSAASSASNLFQPVTHYLPERSSQSSMGDANSTSTASISRVTTTPKSSNKASLKPDTTDALEDALIALSVASDSNSDNGSWSSGSSHQDSGTVTSDGGFTDYLSDESEAEIQRQAEARAALLELNRQEEQEFKAARQQLATIDLHPPKGWNITVSHQSPTFTPGSSPYLHNHTSSSHSLINSSTYSITRGR